MWVYTFLWMLTNIAADIVSQETKTDHVPSKPSILTVCSASITFNDRMISTTESHRRQDIICIIMLFLKEIFITSIISLCWKINHYSTLSCSFCLQYEYMKIMTSSIFFNCNFSLLLWSFCSSSCNFHIHHSWSVIKFFQQIFTIQLLWATWLIVFDFLSLCLIGFWDSIVKIFAYDIVNYHRISLRIRAVYMWYKARIGCKMGEYELFSPSRLDCLKNLRH